ncbi:MAG: D-Ala-D-Ala carboxypeptidase family metallohydrolase [Bacteroidales bacterium]|nr:D-Ala-D-Ala carboxypeptidase family metallohydrolase [Bacteroidales bacterium]
MKYFTISELCASSTATAKKIDNTPTEEVIANLTALVDVVLDPLREAWGEPIIVNSGYRCSALNTAVGGSKTSQHMTGQAADIVPKNKTKARVKELFQKILDLGLPFDQLINESDYSWVHVSYKANGTNRKQVLNL